jgi:hypothetical protein
MLTMKKILLTGIAAMLSASLFSQIFTDNFDAYTAGQNLVTQNSTDWDTWNGGAGTTEDVAVSSANASSGANSLYFGSTGGGPSDIILRFNQVYNSGNFSLEANFLVENGKGAYFNLQETFEVGDVWAMDCFMLDDGTFNLKSGSTLNLSTTYPTGEWFNMRIEIDLTANVWELFIDDVSQGTFSNPIGSIGILNIYPTNPPTEGGNDVAGFYVDDVTYDHIITNLPPVNGGVTYVSPISGIVTQSVVVDGRVRNLGEDPITSFDIEYTYNGMPAVKESVGPISLASLATYLHVFTPPVSLVEGDLPLTVTVSNVNGAGADANASDDANTIMIDPIVPAAGKMVLGEEATGTWCQWCPRGAVWMEYMETTYPNYWAGAAVHNQDPMTDETYDTGLGTKISGYPSSLVDRGTEADPETMEESFLERIVLAPKAFLTNGATYDSETRTLEVSVSADFQSSTGGDWRIGLILTEDGVTGTNGYDQVNAYADGASGEMGGYEALPNPVPAAQMVYDHVARSISPGFEGLSESFPSIIPSGLVVNNCFSFVLPAEWDETKIHIISFLRNPGGTVDNAAKETIASAITNGYANCATSVQGNTSKAETFNLFPNPTSGVTYIDITNNDGDKVNVTITDLSGKIIAQRDYDVNGSAQLPIVTNEFSKGIYVVTLTKGGTIQQQKLIVQ